MTKQNEDLFLCGLLMLARLLMLVSAKVWCHKQCVLEKTLLKRQQVPVEGALSI